jgi:hypothetical protein
MKIEEFCNGAERCSGQLCPVQLFNLQYMEIVGIFFKL